MPVKGDDRILISDACQRLIDELIWDSNLDVMLERVGCGMLIVFIVHVVGKTAVKNLLENGEDTLTENQKKSAPVKFLIWFKSKVARKRQYF